MAKETLNETFFLKVLLLCSGCYFLFGFVLAKCSLLINGVVWWETKRRYFEK